MTKINKIQKLQFDLMRQATFNNFSGDWIVDSLLANRDLWKGVIMDRGAYGALYGARRAWDEGQDALRVPLEPIDFIKLRDIGAGYWNVDTVYILPEEGKEDALELLVLREWGADEVDYIDGQDAGKRVLRVWWD